MTATAVGGFFMSFSVASALWTSQKACEASKSLGSNPLG